jgi:hypothetical protein
VATTRDDLVARLIRAGELEVSGEDQAETDRRPRISMVGPLQVGAGAVRRERPYVQRGRRVGSASLESNRQHPRGRRQRPGQATLRAVRW